jgi:hypothetical protein
MLLCRGLQANCKAATVARNSIAKTRCVLLAVHCCRLSSITSHQKVLKKDVA